MSAESALATVPADRPQTVPGRVPVAVIDIGTSAIRMAVAEIDPQGIVHLLETLSQAVPLGKDTFTRGTISRSTIEECVRILSRYRRLLQEYHIVQPDRIRVVATSAVREAENRLAFIDRIYIASGLLVEPIDEAEVNRITYMGIQPFFASQPALARGHTIITEVGGGSTELLLVHNGEVAYSHTCRLGSLRLRETLEGQRAPAARRRRIMENHIQRTLEQVRAPLPREGPVDMIAIGGDVRFAASQLLPDWRQERLAKVTVAALARFADEVLGLGDDELVARFHLSYPEAETLGPGLLTYVHLAKAVGASHVLISSANLRDGLLEDMAKQGAWTAELGGQIIRSALDLGRKFRFDEGHAQQVAKLARALFRELAPEHRLDPRFELLLTLAALLHEIGHFVSPTSHHKHSMYLILNSELFGLGRRDMLLVALVARYHRRASPRPTHEGYVALEREQRVAVAKMAALLRVADALDRSHSQRIDQVQCVREEGRLVLAVPGVEDLSLEQLALKQKGTLFEEVFGMPVLLRPVGS